jgi:hypothetical protein
MNPQQNPNQLWARLKPKNKKIGHVLERLNALGQVWRGGDGVKKIPRWYPVSPAVAEQLLYFRQIQERPYTPLAFDIVNTEQKLQIERAEEYARQAALGVAAPQRAIPGMHVQGVDVTAGTGAAPTAKVADIDGRQSTLDPETLRRIAGAPSMLRGAEAHLQQAAPQMTPQQQMQMGLGPAPQLPGQVPGTVPAPTTITETQPQVPPGVPTPQMPAPPLAPPAPPAPMADVEMTNEDLSEEATVERHEEAVEGRAAALAGLEDASAAPTRTPTRAERAATQGGPAVSNPSGR